MGERHRPAVRGPNRERLSVARERAGKRDPARGGCPDGRAGLTGDVDAAMALGGVLAAAIVERTEHAAGRRPGPPDRSGREHKRDKRKQGCQA
jgi:hypothetical protein